MMDFLDDRCEGQPPGETAGSEPETPEARACYRLGDLLAEVSPDTCHDETDWGPAVGREVW